MNVFVILDKETGVIHNVYARLEQAKKFLAEPNEGSFYRLEVHHVCLCSE